jgi:hypothetical protein
MYPSEPPSVSAVAFQLPVAQAGAMRPNKRIEPTAASELAVPSFAALLGCGSCAAFGVSQPVVCVGFQEFWICLALMC